MPRAFESIPEEFITETAVYDHKTPITSVMNKIQSYGAIVVTKNGEYFGVVDTRGIARRGETRLTEKVSVGKFATKVKLLDRSTSIHDAIAEFSRSSMKALPFTEANRIKGIVKRDAIMRAVLSLHLLGGISVEEAMSAPVIAIDSGASVAQAKSTMNSYKVNRLVVVQQKKLYGIITYSDIIKNFTTLAIRVPSPTDTRKLDKASSVSVGDTSVRNVYTVGYNAPIENALRMLIENNISSLVVLRGEAPVGMLTIRDILERVVASSKEPEQRVIISGLDEQTKEYEADIKSSLDSLADRVDRFQKFRVEYVSVHVKHKRARNYELHGRIMMGRNGIVSTSSFGYSLEEALKSLVEKLYGSVKTKKEIIVANQKEEGELSEEQ